MRSLSAIKTGLPGRLGFRPWHAGTLHLPTARLVQLPWHPIGGPFDTACRTHVPVGEPTRVALSRVCSRPSCQPPSLPGPAVLHPLTMRLRGLEHDPAIRGRLAGGVHCSGGCGTTNPARLATDRRSEATEPDDRCWFCWAGDQIISESHNFLKNRQQPSISPSSCLRLYTAVYSPAWMLHQLSAY